MHILLHPTYFSNISHFVGIVNAETVTFELHDNYQKQTYRNRTHIYGANGTLSLNIPVKYSQINRQLYKDVKIANTSKWQSIHWKSLQSAYRTSPFFEFYEDELAPLFHSKQNFLLDFNFQCFNLILECIQFHLTYKTTTKYQKEIVNKTDLRYLANVRKEKDILFEPYTQVFHTKHGYIHNLSILDLLFNEGSNALNYLESQKLLL